ncbi:hypothetical protein B0H19DRAFT_1176787 [Mycena capillaripes]|nr:hypothetical protein B0H19DRAFT_1176787 [Mycena capillaripes]
MPARTGYVQPAGSPPWGFPYAGTAHVTSPLNYSRCAPLPALDRDIHSVLSAHSRHKLALDVAYDPAYTPGLSPRVLAEPATTARLPYFSMTCDVLPWCIDVRSSSSKSGAFVTIADVLNSIYRDLRRPVCREELEAMSLPPHVISSVRQAFHSRCSRLAQVDPTAAESEARKGIRRIDFCRGNSLFGGLQPTDQSPDVWKLTFYS